MYSLYSSPYQVDSTSLDTLSMVACMMQGAQERPWIPGTGAPGMVLLNPEGTRHLSFDMQKGAWSRLLENNRLQPLQVSEAVRLRPSDVDTIIKWTVLYCLRKGPNNKQVNELIDDLADGMKMTFSYLIQQAGLR
jgi:hypothetical protein